MSFLSLLETSPVALYGLVFMLGLLVGSFLNVVVYRLPVMMQREWLLEAQSIVAEADVDTNEATTTAPNLDENRAPFNLVVPRSRCPQCSHQITWYENIPVVSWLALRGKCSSCSTRISARYPLVELAAAVLATVTAMIIGFGPWLPAVIVASWCLLALAMIDFDTTLLPDQITLPLLWAGILCAAIGFSPVALADAVYGAALGYLSLWSVYWLFKSLTGKEGMGYGDFKLLAALGAWLGWQMIPLTILLSSVVGAVVGLTLLATGSVQRNQGIPFGPYLAGAGWLALLWGETIVTAYLGLFRF
jgi:leader peptidase (prepilin peptidase) / N-methyltransferase